MKQDRKLRNKLKNLWSIGFLFYFILFIQRLGHFSLLPPPSTGFDKGVKNTQSGQDNLIIQHLQMMLENLISTCRRMKLYIHISYHRIINAKWLEYLNTKPETLKLLDKSKEEILTLV
jgi:hypothetical protein